ncbi:PREDICTED: uncharacterized protein LOC105971173, partial [Erythranthe guttata]|uniref:uncharacterized protein LOC105971173 n=1 Tax=Erythranthe guttata TaxID=4155 RepID=UPI00064D8C57
MLKSIGKYGKGLKPRSYQEVIVSYLKDEVKHVKNSMEKYTDEWKRWGGTLMCDGWTDRKSRSITNFLVNSPSGTVLLNSIYTSNVINDVQKMFELLDKMIVEIEVENVVQVVTNGASNLVSAGEKLEENTSSCWSPCAPHCLDFVLEDIGKIPILYSTITNAKRITTYIYRHQWVLGLFRDYSQRRKLARPAVTRFATSFLTLSCILNQKSALKSMLVSEEWTSSSYARKHDVLRFVDGDSKPAIPYIYEAMDRAKDQIAQNFNNVKS